MTDIVELLRLEIQGYTDKDIDRAEKYMREAADEIERLRKHIVLLEMAFSKALGQAAVEQAVKNLFETGNLAGKVD